MGLLNVAGPYEGPWKTKAENWLVSQFPSQIDDGWYNGIHVGRNRDAAVNGGDRFKTRSQAIRTGAGYLEVPGTLIPPGYIANSEALIPTFTSSVADAVLKAADVQVKMLVKQGVKPEDAKAQVAGAISAVGWFDRKAGKYVTERVLKSTHDSILSGMTTPYWNVSRIQKVFRAPVLRGYAEHLVKKVGVPNIWADIIQIYVASYEGRARVSSAARTTGASNTAVGAASRTGTMLSEIINLMIDYEYPTPEDQRIAGMEGWLTGMQAGERDVYADLMLEQLMNILYYFGHDESGFQGLRQIADRDDAFDYYPSDRPTAQYLWEHDGAGAGTPVNPTVGADLLLMLNHFIAGRLEELHFLPLDIKISCAPVLWKALKWSMMSKVYNPNSPLNYLSTAFEAEDKITGTLVTRSGDDTWHGFSLVPDPMLAPGTPFNDTDEDLMFITFPSLQSEMGDQSELVMAPVLIDRMILPVAPQYRDGSVRTALRRIGSLLCPVRKTVHVLSGMGVNARYAP